MSALGSPFGPLGSPFGSPFSAGSASPLSFGDPFSGHTGFGFNIPLGDPAAIESAATDMRTMGDGFHGQARSIRVAASVAVEGDGGWKGSASAAFADFAGHLINIMNGNATACQSAAKAISQLGHALSHAQKVTRQALSDCEKFSTEITTQQGLADDAATAERNATQNAANATHPSVAQTYNHQASVARDDKVTAQNAATTAQGNLRDAEKRGHDAEQTYQQEATKLSATIGSAASELRSPPDAGKAAPVPVTSSGSDIMLASMVTLMGSMGAVKGPLVDAVPPSERTPGFVNALIQDQRNLQEKEMQGGGARGPYSLWSNEFFGKDAGAVNAQVEAGKMPPMPSNWGSMTGAQRQQYLWSTTACFPACPARSPVLARSSTRPAPAPARLRRSSTTSSTCLRTSSTGRFTTPGRPRRYWPRVCAPSRSAPRPATWSASPRRAGTTVSTRPSTPRTRSRSGTSGLTRA